MPFVESRGCKLYYLLEGDAEKPVVLLSNSLGADISMWDAQMLELLRHFRVLRYDTRGHGRSEVFASSAALGELGNDVIHLLDQVGIDRVHMCGVSLGGLTTMWVALHAPDRLHSVVLSNTAARIGTRAAWDERIGTVNTAGLAAIADSVPLRWFTAAYQVDANAMTKQKAMLLRCSALGYAGASAAVRDADLRGEVSAISLPSLVISGAEDMATPPADGRALAAAIPGAEFKEVPGAHLSNIEEPEAYNRALLPFLRHHTPFSEKQ